MNTGWESNAAAKRPERLPLFPRGMVFFRRWRTLRWFLLLLLPVVASAAAAGLRGRGPAAVAILLLFGLAVAAVIFVDLNLGMSSSNWGVFHRRRQPIRYWLAVGCWALFYLVVAIAGYIS